MQHLYAKYGTGSVNMGNSGNLFRAHLVVCRDWSRRFTDRLQGSLFEPCEGSVTLTVEFVLQQPQLLLVARILGVHVLAGLAQQLLILL